MSATAGAPIAAGASPPQPYWCHQCNRTVSLSPSPNSDLLCPICNSGFLEEIENHPPPTNPFFSFSDSPTYFSGSGGGHGLGGMPFIFSSSSTSTSPGSVDLQNPADLAALFNPRNVNQEHPDAFNPFIFLQNYLQTLMAGGANIQFVVENSDGMRMPMNLGDYFIGPGLEQLIQQLAENDPNRYGTPPASKSAIEALPEIRISADLLATDEAQCAVCKDTFEIGSEAKQMPCKHIYHSDCILPWLELHNSCPVCRYELPTDDPDYENRTSGMPPQARETGGGGGGGGGAGAVVSLDSGVGGGGAAGGAEPNTPTGRRFRISLPWPFRAFGSPAETSRTNDGSEHDSSNQEGNRGNRDSTSETRDEALD